MGTLYSGVAASLTTGVQITVPSDGDLDNAATFDVGMQKLADYAEAFRTRVRSGSIIDLQWSAPQAGTFAATATLVLAAPPGTSLATATFGPDVTPTVGAAGVHRLTANTAGVYRVWVSGGLNNGTANAVLLAIMKNGGTAVVTHGVFGQLTNGTAAPFTAESYLSLVATDFVQLAFYGTIAQTYSVATAGTVDVWFGMERIA
jgi:hypothetical protein